MRTPASSLFLLVLATSGSSSYSSRSLDPEHHTSRALEIVYPRVRVLFGQGASMGCRLPRVWKCLKHKDEGAGVWRLYYAVTVTSCHLFGVGVNYQDSLLHPEVGEVYPYCQPFH